LAAVVCLLAAGALPVPASADPPFIERHPVYGGFDTYFGDCPDVELPAAGTVCIDNYLIVYRSYRVVGGGSVAPPNAPWNVAAETYLVEWTGTFDPIVEVLRSGGGELDGEASVDTVHLQTAAASLRLPMSDGSTLEFEGNWQAITDRQLFGNDGEGGPVHFVDPCQTLNSHAHQKFTGAAMTGTANGEPVHSYTFSPTAYIFNNRYLFIDVPHGGPGCGA
jgi:hypothetical protein